MDEWMDGTKSTHTLARINGFYIWVSFFSFLIKLPDYLLLRYSYSLSILLSTFTTHKYSSSSTVVLILLLVLLVLLLLPPNLFTYPPLSFLPQNFLPQNLFLDELIFFVREKKKKKKVSLLIYK